MENRNFLLAFCMALFLASYGCFSLFLPQVIFETAYLGDTVKTYKAVVLTKMCMEMCFDVG